MTTRPLLQLVPKPPPAGQYTPTRVAGLDRIGQAFATYDLCPCDDCWGDIAAAVREYDRL